MPQTKKQLERPGLVVRRVLHNPSPAKLYEHSILREQAAITASGALSTSSGEKTGRSPRDKRIVDHPQSSGDIWWGDINMKIDESSFLLNRQRAIDYLNTRDLLYVVDGYAGWAPKYRITIRVICERTYHALFMHNMLIRASVTELDALVPKHTWSDPEAYGRTAAKLCEPFRRNFAKYEAAASREICDAGPTG